MAGFTSPDDFWREIQKYVLALVKELIPQRMIVVAVDTDGIVEVKPVNPQPEDGSRFCSQIHGLHLDPDDEVWVQMKPGVDNVNSKMTKAVGIVTGIVRRSINNYSRQEFDHPMDIRARSADNTALLRLIDFAGTPFFAADSVTHDLTVDGLVAKSNKFIVPGQKSQPSADTGSTASTSVYATAMTDTLVLPDGTWSVWGMASVAMNHSANGTVRCALQIDGSGATSIIQGADATIHERVAVTQLVTGIAGNRTINVDTLFRSSAAGTSTADQPAWFGFGIRTA